MGSGSTTHRFATRLVRDTRVYLLAAITVISGHSVFHRSTFAV
jgi:hypothetical protein